LVDQVIFRPTAEAGLEVELVGDIARMVHLAQNSNENSPVSGAVHDEFDRSVKVVAGLATSVTCTWTMRSFKCAKYEFRSRATHR
jgi:hypothetical protein